MIINAPTYGDLHEELRAMDVNSTNRRLEAANPADFIKWVQDYVRQHHETLASLKAEHAKLNEAANAATIGLNRLITQVTDKQSQSLENLTAIHRDFVAANENMGYTLSRCANMLKDTITNYQLVAETLTSKLADRQKKSAAQQELGLRLDDIATQLGRCRGIVDKQKVSIKQLQVGIQNLLSQTGIKLPPEVRETQNREDQVKRIAMRLNKTLEQGKDRVNYTPFNPATERKIEIAVPRLDGFDMPCLGAAIIGGIIGVVAVRSLL